MTSKPLARGSSVPVWPARLAPRRRFALCNTAFELGPTGLSMSSTPLTAALVFSTGAQSAFFPLTAASISRSEEHTSELQSQSNLVCRLLLEKKQTTTHVSGLPPP